MSSPVLVCADSAYYQQGLVAAIVKADYGDVAHRGREPHAIEVLLDPDSRGLTHQLVLTSGTGRLE